jgi:hypothetical protein
VKYDTKIAVNMKMAKLAKVMLRVIYDTKRTVNTEMEKIIKGMLRVKW